jgi:hypothetical protein
MQLRCRVAARLAPEVMALRSNTIRERLTSTSPAGDSWQEQLADTLVSLRERVSATLGRDAGLYLWLPVPRTVERAGVTDCLNEELHPILFRLDVVNRLADKSKIRTMHPVASQAVPNPSKGPTRFNEMCDNSGLNAVLGVPTRRLIKHGVVRRDSSFVFLTVTLSCSCQWRAMYSASSKVQMLRGSRG